MTTEIKRLIRVRTEKGAVFKRDGFGKKKQTLRFMEKAPRTAQQTAGAEEGKGQPPQARLSAARLRCAACTPAGSLKCWCSRKKISKILTRRPRRSGYQPVVGARKRKGLQEKAAASGFKILNTRVIKERVAEEKPAAPEKDTVKAKKDTKETKKAPAKKSASNAEGARKKGADEKKPVKAAATKSKPAAKEPEKKEEKAAKPKAKEGAKAPSKKPAPAKTEKKPAAPEEKPKAAKAKAKKMSSSEVKKNE